MPACAQTIVGPSARREELGGERGGPHRALCVGLDDFERGRAEAEIAQRAVDGAVPLLADDETDTRRALQPVALVIPTVRLEHGMTSGRERGEVRHHPAGDERERHVGGQAEHRRELATDDLLARGRSGRRRRERRVLIPRGGEVVGGEGRIEVAADDEAEVPRARHPLQTWRRPTDEVVDHLCRGATLLGHVACERIEHLRVARSRRDRAVVERLEEVGGVIGGVVQEGAQVAHRTGLTQVGRDLRCD